MTYLKLKVSMTDKAELPKLPGGTNRQRTDNDIVLITKEKLPLKFSRVLYNLDKSFDSYLKPEFNIESDADEIIARANAIVGDEKNPFNKAGKLMNWVYDNVDKRPIISIPSAIEVLKTMVGDCNEHATLLTALLRASDIPARLSVGLVYNRGKFYYHAWTEAYIGGWITMDATLNQMPADVTHICLVSGNLDKQVEIMGLIGRLKLEVLDFGYN
jgi:transglutaminase-like putative cysteine protease